MKLSGFVIVACVGLAASAQAQVSRSSNTAPQQAEQFQQVEGAMEFSGRLIVRPLQFETLAERGLKQAQIEATIRQAKALLANYQEFWYEPMVDHHVIIVPEGETENTLAAKLMETGLYGFAEPDWILYPIANCPNDPRLGNQWHHNSNRMASCEAWDIHTGTPAVTVGICDTGIQTSHPDFQLNRKEGYNAVNRIWENSGGNIEPVHPHGTMTTGCAAANGNNNTGVSGVGWNLSHRMMRVSNTSSGSSSSSTLTHAALTSIQSGDKVANVSYSGVNSGAVRSTATTIKNLGGLLTWSAGNSNETWNWGDRDADDVIVVGATTINDIKSSFSAKGRSVDFMAPGTNVHTTNTGSGYSNVSGTSFSAPLTAGLIGLIWSYNPSLTPDEVEFIVKNGCDDLGTNGIDDTFGYGRINSFNSLLLVGGGGAGFPFFEPFEEDTLNENVWPTNNGGVVSTSGTNEPSDPYSLNLDSADSITSADFNLSNVNEAPFVGVYTQHKGVENGETLTVEYKDFFGDWNTLITVTSDGNDQTDFAYHTTPVPITGWSPDFALRISAQGSDTGDDWFVDDISVAFFEGNNVPFVEEFGSTSLSQTTWGTVTGSVNTEGTNEPSDPYSLNLDNAESATSNNFLLSNASFPTYISFYTQHAGVESGETLDIEYVALDGTWKNYMTITSDGNDQGSFQFHQSQVPVDSYHDDFAFRFIANGGDSTDNWFVDDIRLGDEFTPPDDCFADFNGDGSVNTTDVLAFLNAWNAGDISADCNGDGSINTTDVLCFLNLWNAGC